MNTRYYLSNNGKNWKVTRNEVGFLTITDLQTNRPHQSPCSLIKQYGGVDKFWEILTTQEDYDAILAVRAARKAYLATPEGQAELKVKEEARRAKRERLEIMFKERAEREERQFDELKGKAIEPTADNLRIILNHYNRQNWGMWDLSEIKLSCGATILQHDCGGVIATTIKLDTPIEYDGKMETRFMVGGKRGYLTKYISL